MPIIDIKPRGLDAPLDTPEGFAVTPGKLDIDHGSDAPDMNWANGIERPALDEVGRTVGAAFRQGNLVGSYFSSPETYVSNDPEPGFNPWDSIKGTKYEPQWSSFVDVRNNARADAVKRQIDMEGEDRRTLQAAPWYESVPAQLVAGTLDLPTLVPGGAFVRGVRGGYSVSRSALSVGLAAGGATLAQEGGLHALQETRPISESAVNVGASVLLGGLIGAGGAKLLNRAEWSQAVADLDRGLSPKPVPVPEANAPQAGGAAANAPVSLESNTVAGRTAGVIADSTAQLNPALRALTSPSAAYRDIATNLFENSVYLKKNMEGGASAPAVETLMREWNGGLANSLISTDEAFSRYRKSGGELSRSEFREQVGRSMRRGDTSDIPEVAEVAKAWRSQVFDPLKEAAIKARLLPEDVSVDTAVSYFTRMWNRNKLIAREGQFKQIVQDWVGRELPSWATSFDKASERKLKPLHDEIEYEEMAKLRRAEELRRASEGETDIDSGVSEAGIRQAMRIVQGGAPKPKGVKTLTQFVADAGGLVDFGGEIAYRGINNKARPGFVRKAARPVGAKGSSAGGWHLDDMARHAWESGFFPEHTSRPSVDEFLDALTDDFFKVRAVVRPGDQEAFRLTDLVNQLENDLGRIGIDPSKPVRFSTSEELKGMMSRVYEAMEKEADARIKRTRAKLAERQATIAQDRESRFLGDERELGRQIADEVFNTLTGRVEAGMRPEFMTIKARGPLKERTFNIPDSLVEDFLEHDVDLVGRRYTRIMGADVEMAGRFGSVDLKEQITAIRADYDRLRAGLTDEKTLLALGKRERADIRDLEAMRDLLRGTRQEGPWDRGYATIARAANHFNYLRSMGEVVLASLTDAVRPAMVHGLAQFMVDVPKLAIRSAGTKAAIEEAKLAGNITERVLGHRLATITEIIDPYTSRGPTDKFLENMTNVASRWNGIRIWTDAMKSIAAVMTQNRVLGNIEKFASVKGKEKAYMAYLGIDEGMAGRIATQYGAHGETIDGVRVANTADWNDAQAVRTFRAAINKDVNSIIVERSVADVPLFAHTPTGKMILQFKSYALASHQKVLLRGLQEDKARFASGMVAMTAVGMMITWLKAISGNRPETQEKALSNPGWWIGEGLDRAGVVSVPMELANAFEKIAGVNPLKSPLKVFDEKSQGSQRMQNRNDVGTLFGPSYGSAQDLITVAGIPGALLSGKEITRGQKNAAERSLPFNSYLGVRQLMRYLINPQY